MVNFAPVSSYSSQELSAALKAGSLEVALGPFTARAKGEGKPLRSFLQDTYRDVMVRLSLSDVTDIALDVRAPSLLRKYIRPQVIPDPGFQVPAVPLPKSMSGLAFEMGLNLVVALKCCRFVTFHAGVVANDKGAILMSAESGGGKSTLVAALMEEGYRLYSDEFALLNMPDARLASYPRPVSLKNESIEIVRDFAGGDWVSPVISDTPKGKIAYRRARPEDITEAGETAVTKLVLFPRFEAGVRASARGLRRAEAIMRLIPSSTNYHLLGEQGFNALRKMLDGAEAFEITYGTTDDSMKMVRDLAAKVGL